MGGKLGKAQQTINSMKITGQANGVATKTHRDHQDSNGSAKLMKKKKEKTSSNGQVDKSTSTDGGVVVPSSSTVKHLVGYVTQDNLSHDAFMCQSNCSHSSETPSRDVLELRDACFRRGLISAEFHPVQPIVLDQEEQASAVVALDTQEELLVDEPSVVPVTDIDEVRIEQDQTDA